MSSNAHITPATLPADMPGQRETSPDVDIGQLREDMTNLLKKLLNQTTDLKTTVEEPTTAHKDKLIFGDVPRRVRWRLSAPRPPPSESVDGVQPSSDSTTSNKPKVGLYLRGPKPPPSKSVGNGQSTLTSTTGNTPKTGLVVTLKYRQSKQASPVPVVKTTKRKRSEDNSPEDSEHQEKKSKCKRHGRKPLQLPEASDEDPASIVLPDLSDYECFLQATVWEWAVSLAKPVCFPHQFEFPDHDAQLLGLRPWVEEDLEVKFELEDMLGQGHTVRLLGKIGEKRVKVVGKYRPPGSKPRRSKAHGKFWSKRRSS